MFSTVGTAGVVNPGDTGKVLFTNSTVQLGGGDGVVVASKLDEQVSATIRYPISPADMPQVQVEDLMLHINYRLGSTTGTGAATVFPHVKASLWEVAYFVHPGGVVSEAVLFAFDSLADINGQDFPNQFVTSTTTISPTGTPQATHVCDSSKNAYYIELTVTGPQPLPPQSSAAPAVSAIWLTIT